MAPRTLQIAIREGSIGCIRLTKSDEIGWLKDDGTPFWRYAKPLCRTENLWAFTNPVTGKVEDGYTSLRDAVKEHLRLDVKMG